MMACSQYLSVIFALPTLYSARPNPARQFNRMEHSAYSAWPRRDWTARRRTTVRLCHQSFRRSRRARAPASRCCGRGRSHANVSRSFKECCKIRTRRRALKNCARFPISAHQILDLPIRPQSAARKDFRYSLAKPLRLIWE